MGACEFATQSDKADVSEAFDDCRTAACYEHGHGGYTGTIAEKGGYVVFDLPAGRTVDEFVEAVREYDFERQQPTPPDWIPRRIAEAYDDKWGPAVAVRRPEGGWLFCGWASE